MMFLMVVIKRLKDKMKRIIIKEVKIDNGGFGGEIEQTWYIVRLKNPILHFLSFFAFNYYRPFLSKKDAINCVRLLEVGKWKYTRSKTILKEDHA